MLPAIVAVLTAVPTSLTLAVLPCEPLHQARAEEAGWLDEKISEDLAALVELVPRERVLAAMEARGVEGASACDDGCLAQLGKELGADRVVRATLTIQRKMQSEGAVWVWVLHQVRVEPGEAYGHFERAGVRPRSYWREWSRELAQRLALFDPATRVELADPAPARPAAGPVEIPGMVYVPGGEFVMGGEFGEPDELPRHIVRLDPYYIGEHEVTIEEYRPCVDQGVCPEPCIWNDPKFNQPRQPVVCANWDDAVAYCAFRGGRLPTEAEWEYAARGTDERRFPWGDDWHPEWVNQHTPDDGYKHTAPVGSFPENRSPFGAYDMAGNAWEWVRDYWVPDYYPTSPRHDPPGSSKGKRRVMRGGSWMYDVPFFVTTSNRSPGWPFRRKEYVGLRCAMDVPD